MVLTTAKWTIDDYHRMIDAGILANRSVELLNGEIVDMVPEGPEHAQTSSDTADYLKTLLGIRAKVRDGHPITLPNHSEPEPDIAVVRPLGQVYRHRHPYTEDVFWLIEYSNTSLAKDLDAKRQIYSAAGIPEYWLVDLQHRCLRVFRNPTEANYLTEVTLTTGIIQPLAFPDVTVSVQQLLDGSA
jgi:Uma2 family endonuclease